MGVPAPPPQVTPTPHAPPKKDTWRNLFPVAWRRFKITSGLAVGSAVTFFLLADLVLPRFVSEVELADGSKAVLSDQPCRPYWMYLRLAGIDRKMSRAFGVFAETEFPESIRGWMWWAFGTLYNVKWKEHRSDIEAFKTFNEFFTRPLTIPRPFMPNSLVCPVDGKVLITGKVHGNKLEQIKGVSYHADKFLGYAPAAYSPGNNLYYAVLYLAPGNYHRFHSPCECIFDHVQHFPGALLPVKKNVVQGYPGLFSINERVVLTGTWQSDRYFAYIPVGATNVGSIEICEDEELKTNLPTQDEDSRNSGYNPKLSEPYPAGHSQNPFKRGYLHSYGNPMHKMKGQEVGAFRMGSTVVLIFEAESANFLLGPGDDAVLGQPLADCT